METLTYDFYLKYGNRKKPGRMSIFTDLDNDRIYGVPLGIEHKDFACQIFNASLDEIIMYTRLIPSHIDTMLFNEMPRVTGLITGVSGLEIDANVRHYMKDLLEAHQRSWEFINCGELEKLEGNLNDEVVKRYVIDH